MEQLLRYHIEVTEKQFTEMREELVVIRDKLDALQEFKIQMLTNSRTVSFVVSAICGLVTMVVSGIVNYLIQTHGGK